MFRLLFTFVKAFSVSFIFSQLFLAINLDIFTSVSFSLTISSSLGSSLLYFAVLTIFLCSFLTFVGGGWVPPINERGLPSIDLFVLVICEDKSELTIGDSGVVGDRSAHVSQP